MTEGGHIYWDTCGAQRTTEWFSPSTMSVLRIKLRLSGLEAPLPAEASHQPAFLSCFEDRSPEYPRTHCVAEEDPEPLTLQSPSVKITDVYSHTQFVTCWELNPGQYVL